MLAQVQILSLALNIFLHKKKPPLDQAVFYFRIFFIVFCFLRIMSAVRKESLMSDEKNNGLMVYVQLMDQV